MIDTYKDDVDPRLDLLLERVIEVRPELVFQAWTRPELMPKWFAPEPWKASGAAVDLRPGGGFQITMQGPDGQEIPCQGCYLEVIENKRLVWTDALGPGFRPRATPFFTAIITLERQGGGTLYRVVAKHKDEADRQKHEEMGFHSGWNKCLDQLVAVVSK